MGEPLIRPQKREWQHCKNVRLFWPKQVEPDLGTSRKLFLHKPFNSFSTFSLSITKIFPGKATLHDLKSFPCGGSRTRPDFFYKVGVTRFE